MKSSTYLRWITAWWITAAAILAFGVFAKAPAALAQQPNGTINAPIYATGYISVAAATSVTTNIPPQPNHPTNLNIYALGPITTWTINLPNPGFEGQILGFSCAGAVTTVTIQPTDGSAVDPAIPTSCAANTGFAIQFDLRSNIWRNLPGPIPTAIPTFACAAHQWLSSGVLGAAVCSRPGSSDVLNEAPSGMPNALSAALSVAEQNRYDATKWGVSTSASDNATALNNAISDIASNGGGFLLLPPGTITTGKVTLRSHVYIHGQGKNQTIIKLKNGVNDDLLVGLNAYAEFASPSGTGGITDWGLFDLTLDGNMANQNNGGCLALFGYSYILQNIVVRNCYGVGIRTAFQDFSGVGSMESAWTNVTVDTTGSHGVWNNGPHDSIYTNLIVIDASQAANNTSYGVFCDTYCNGRWTAFHGWHRGSVTNRTAHQFYDSAGGSNFSNSHFEGSYGSTIVLAGVHTQLDASNTYYVVWGNNFDHVDIRGSNNIVMGSILGNTNDDPRDNYGLGLSNGAAGNVIDMAIGGVDLGAVNFIGEGGLNTIRINGAVATGPGYTGSPSASSKIDIDIYGATSNGNLHQYPNAYTFLAAPIFTTLTGYLKGNGSSALTASATIPTSDLTGILGLSHGGTGSDLSATGGTSQVLKQTTLGGAVTVAQLAASDLSNGTTGSGSVALATSPTFTTPTLGDATATSVTAGGATAINDIDAKNVGVQGNLRIYPSGSTASWTTLYFDGTGVRHAWPFIPTADNNIDSAASSYRFGTVWAYRSDAKNFHTTQANPPTLTSCGTGGSVDSSSSGNAGKITFGSGTTSCVVVFAYDYPTQAWCTVTPVAQPAAVANIPYISGQTSHYFVISGGTASASYQYTCGGN